MKIDLKECARGCAKGCLMGLNGVCIFTAFWSIGFAVVDLKIIHQYDEGTTTGAVVADVFVIVASLIIIVTASFGCLGAAREDVKLLYMYVGLLICLAVTELMLGVFVSLQRYGLEFKVQNWLRDDFFKNVTGDDMIQQRQMWDYLQTNYECCGLNGPEDYLAMGEKIDLSCCPTAQRTRNDRAQELLYVACVNLKDYYVQGCEEEILLALREGSECMFSTAAICFLFEVAGCLLSMYIANNLKNEVKVYKETLKY